MIQTNLFYVFFLGISSLTLGALHSTRFFANFFERKSPWKFLENLKIVQFPKSEPLNRKFPVKFQKIWVYITKLFSFLCILKNAIPLAPGNFWKLELEFFFEMKVPTSSCYHVSERTPWQGYHNLGTWLSGKLFGTYLLVCLR